MGCEQAGNALDVCPAMAHEECDKPAQYKPAMKAASGEADTSLISSMEKAHVSSPDGSGPSNAERKQPASENQGAACQPDDELPKPTGTGGSQLKPSSALDPAKVASINALCRYPLYEDVESMRRYEPGPGAFHPTYIGDEFSQGRYRVIHKLGHGGYSTVWLARDHQEDRYVALKITEAETTERPSNEAKILRLLEAGDHSHPGYKFVATALDEFAIEGLNGHHKCFVFEVAGFPVMETKDDSEQHKFPIQTARAVAAQAVLGLAYIHSCGVIHGDLHGNNFLFQVDTLDNSMSIKALYEELGEPDGLPVRRCDDEPIGPTLPTRCFSPTGFWMDAKDITNPYIKIHDFGGATIASGGDGQLHTQLPLLPPEKFFKEKITTAADVWTLGCIIFEVLGRRTLFNIWFPNNESMVWEMIELFGPLPERLMEKWEHRDKYFFADGRWRPEKMPKPFRPWSERLREMDRGIGAEDGEIGPDEAECLDRLLRAMLTVEPAERISAADATRQDWMKYWGLPAMEQMVPKSRTAKRAGCECFFEPIKLVDMGANR